MKLLNFSFSLIKCALLVRAKGESYFYELKITKNVCYVMQSCDKIGSVGWLYYEDLHKLTYIAYWIGCVTGYY